MHVLDHQQEWPRRRQPFHTRKQRLEGHLLTLLRREGRLWRIAIADRDREEISPATARRRGHHRCPARQAVSSLASLARPYPCAECPPPGAPADGWQRVERRSTGDGASRRGAGACCLAARWSSSTVWAMRDLPMPGSPASRTTLPSPPTACRQRRSSSAISSSRPTSGVRLAERCASNRLSTSLWPSTCAISTGVADPLSATLPRSRYSKRAPTRRRVFFPITIWPGSAKACRRAASVSVSPRSVACSLLQPRYTAFSASSPA